MYSCLYETATSLITKDLIEKLTPAVSWHLLCHLQMPVSTSKAVRPAEKLQSQPVCDVLIHDIIRPVQQNNWNVSAFRMNWSKTGIGEQSIWDQIVMVRGELDKLAKTIPGGIFVVSAIGASFSPIKSGQKTSYKIHPFVAYWLVSKRMTDNRNLCEIMNTNNCGAQVKIMLQPYQTSEKDISNALFNVVKDNVAGCVRRLVEDSCQCYYGPSSRMQEPLVKIYVAKNGPITMLKQAVGNLSSVRFHADLLEMDASVQY